MSPALPASKMSLQVRFLSVRRELGASVLSRWRLARRTMPVAEQYCSTQPRFPQLQGTVSSRFRTRWPISAPEPWAPWSSFPSTTMPPPTPVPSVTKTMLSQPCPPPFQNSPSAATLASLPAFTGKPVSSVSFWAMLNTSQPRLIHRFTTPFALTGPGTPMPRPRMSESAIFRSVRKARTDAAISGSIRMPFSDVSVGISHFSSIFPASLK